MKKSCRPPGDSLPVGVTSKDPIGGPQGPYFEVPFNKIDTDHDGYITWKELCQANPQVWLEDEKRVQFLEFFGSLRALINERQMNQYIERIKQDLTCGSKYGRPWPYGHRPEFARKKVDWSRKRVHEHRANMPWHERFDHDRGFINYHALSDNQLHELLEDQDEDLDGDHEELIEKLISLRDEDSEYAELVYMSDPDKYMDGRYK